MRRRVIQFNPKIFININSINPTINCFVFRFAYSIKINTFLLHVFDNNTLIHIQFTIINVVPCGYDTLTYFLYYLSTQYTCWRINKFLAPLSGNGEKIWNWILYWSCCELLIFCDCWTSTSVVIDVFEKSGESRATIFWFRYKQDTKTD